MQEWLKREPIIIVEGKGAELRDARGQKYLDANSSIWTNLHGHRHPAINGAIQQQLKKIAHSSALGLANEPASLLAEKLVACANPSAISQHVSEPSHRAHSLPNPHLSKVFFSDDGSTAMEVALKLAYEHARRTGRNKTPKFLSLQGGYHGDTIGAVSLGHIDLFHKAYSGLLFKTDRVMAPYCYRCRFNRAKPERADAREYRKCNWECLDKLEQKFEKQRKQGNPYAGFVFEPLMQGAAGMIPQPAGWLRRAAEMARGNGALMIADEVMTGFGRTGVGAVSEKVGKWVSERASKSVGGKATTHLPTHPLSRSSSLFACHHEGVQPDFLALAKGLTGGYLPMAATLTTQSVFAAFLGRHEEYKTFFHGHSFTANQLGAAAALANLKLLESHASIRARHNLEATLRNELENLWSLPNIGDIRQVGLIVGIELVKDWRTRTPFELRQRVGARVCQAMTRRGVLTRPVGDVIVLMPPYCTTAEQTRRIVKVLRDSVIEVVGK
jgi:adenosylmethionine-8-amino-7-oxononanoate aminotransferase